ncbi:MAG: hypothetical protein Q4P31_01305 [Andreesenia angusta]|nr:hypothetical protein [Andreesenia angusta]
MKSKITGNNLPGADLDIDTVSVEEMNKHFNIIEKNIPILKEKLSRELRQSNGELKSRDIERILDESLDEASLAPKGRRILEGFFEMWMGVFMMIGSDKESLIVALRMLGKEI